MLIYRRQSHLWSLRDHPYITPRWKVGKFDPSPCHAIVTFCKKCTTTPSMTSRFLGISIQPPPPCTYPSTNQGWSWKGFSFVVYVVLHCISLCFCAYDGFYTEIVNKIIFCAWRHAFWLLPTPAWRNLWMAPKLIHWKMLKMGLATWGSKMKIEMHV